MGTGVFYRLCEASWGRTGAEAFGEQTAAIARDHPPQVVGLAAPAAVAGSAGTPRPGGTSGRERGPVPPPAPPLASPPRHIATTAPPLASPPATSRPPRAPREALRFTSRPSQTAPQPPPLA